MSVDIARLQLEADSTQIKNASRDLQTLEMQGSKTERQMMTMAGASKGTADRLHDVSRRATNLSGVMVKLGSAIGAVAGVAGMGYMINQSLKATANLQKQADMAGVTVAAYQEMSYAGQQYQITQDALTDGLKELSLRGADFVRDGAGPAKGAFEALGYSAENLNAMLRS